MAGFGDMSRMKESVTKLVDKLVSKIRPVDSKAVNAEPDVQTDAVIPTPPLWRKKTTLLIGGAIILLTAAGVIGVQKYNEYRINNTFEIFHVYQNGTIIGSVDSKDLVEKLIGDEKLELANNNPGINMVLDTGELTYESETAFKLYAETDATLSALEKSFTSHAVGVAVVVDGKTLGIVKDEAAAVNILSRLQSEYAPALASADSNTRTIESLSFNANETTTEQQEKVNSDEPSTVVTEIGFVEAVDVENVNIDPTEILDEDALYATIVDGSTKPTKYVVQKGDCVGCIAFKFGISEQVIYENNPSIVGDKITAGDELDLTVRMPEITVKSTEQTVEIEEIAIPIEYVKNDEIREGETKTIQTGSAGSQKLTYSIYKENGYILTEELISKEVIVEAVPTIIEKGTMVIAGIGSGQFSYPVTNHRLSSKYGSRWGRTHKGIDITGDKNIKAADAGVVEFVGTKNGYGNTIIIDHQNGYKTLYGHLKSIGVSKGDKLSQGDTIGVMGNTGRSTGVHLHFEILKNGSNVNPLSYL
ncbi:M23 family metallopeptidase [Paenibacillus endoradicis]|uniref:M23 family metallopeptidase n=1 Tax=Paenibacillus endoradicis TaxID=2972487 RepID=UPI00215927B8|nr:M23 family metallopeptidase [Paenibacillus endoradicis]MCR8658514.1 peptidoglycan DD-metalloendopeptidase family protein [Paenibacillus endoradicis]